LEKGNHRIQVLRVFNIQAPVVVELAETTVGNLGNGAHVYYRCGIIEGSCERLATGQYLPSEIFNVMQ
jgi:hypothetical protein